MEAEGGAAWCRASRDIARLALHEDDLGRLLEAACGRLVEAGLSGCFVAAGGPVAFGPVACAGDPALREALLQGLARGELHPTARQALDEVRTVLGAAGDELAVPIVRRSAPVGVLLAVRQGLGADADARAALDDVGRDLGAALGRARAVPTYGDLQRLQRCVEVLPSAVAVLDHELRYLTSSRRWREDYALGEVDLVGRKHFDVFPDAPARWRDVLRRCLTGYFAECVDDTFVRSSGKTEHLHWAVHPWWDATGAVGGLFVHSEVTTSRRETEAALRASQVRLSEQAALLAETGAIAKVGGWEFDVATGAGTWTDEVARIHDMSPGDPSCLERGLSFYEGASRTRVEAAVKAAMELGEPYDLELELTTAAGRVKQVRTIGRPVREGGRVVRVRGSFQDITDRKKIEAELNAERARLRTLLDTLPDLVWLKDLEGRFLVCNRRFELLLGAREAEIMGKTDYDFVPRELADFFRENDRRAIAARGPVTNEESVRFADGHEEVVQTTKTPMLDEGGRLIGVLGIARDVTSARRADEALREVREQLLHSQKMEAVGTLAGGVAHDFNNLLTVISGFTSLVLEDRALPPAAVTRLKQVARAAERAGGLTRQLLAFSRRLPTTPIVVDLGVTVRELEKMLARLIGEHLELRVSIEPDPGSILADPGQVEQVIMNLVVNARDACTTGGRISVEVAPAWLDGASADVRPQVAPGAYVRLSVSDTGAGMDDRVKARLFEPFFSTKEPGKGTGLGLATVYGILQQSRAGIVVESAPDRGARFDVFWPAPMRRSRWRPPRGPRPTAGPRRSSSPRTRRASGSSCARSSPARATTSSTAALRPTPSPWPRPIPGRSTSSSPTWSCPSSAAPSSRAGSTRAAPGSRSCSCPATRATVSPASGGGS